MMRNAWEWEMQMITPVNINWLTTTDPIVSMTSWLSHSKWLKLNPVNIARISIISSSPSTVMKTSVLISLFVLFILTTLSECQEDDSDLVASCGGGGGYIPSSGSSGSGSLRRRRGAQRKRARMRAKQKQMKLKKKKEKEGDDWPFVSLVYGHQKLSTQTL